MSVLSAKLDSDVIRLDFLHSRFFPICSSFSVGTIHLGFFITAGLNVFLEAAYRSHLPAPGHIYHVEYGAGRVFTSPTPNPINLPTVPENRNLTEYINAVDTHNMLLIFASMLCERRILVVSKKLSRLSACVQVGDF